MMENIKATHEIVGIGKRSAHYDDRRKYRKKRGFFKISTCTHPDLEYSRKGNKSGLFTFISTEGVRSIFCCDLNVRELK